MAELSSLIHELRERISASSSSPENNGDDDQLENRFRTVLPNLLQAYVVPSSAANEREVIAVLKLLSHIARNFPGVYFHGKASAVIPVISRVLPFFAEPAFRSGHGIIFETVGSLLSLLRSGERGAYRQFFLDAMLLIEDLLHVASIFADSSTTTVSPVVSLKCFHKSFVGISNSPAPLGDLPACFRPTDGLGILIDLTDNRRWQPFTTWTLKIISKCLTEGTLYVEGLINASFVSAACALLCYGDAALHMAKQSSSITFDLAIYLEAVHSILLSQSSLPQENILFKTMDVDANLRVVLMLPWTHLLAITEADPIWNTKCLVVQVFSKIGFAVKPESVLEILDLALCDEAEELLSALQFYHVQTGSSNQEIFGAALPALLDELVCFLGDGDSNETTDRLTRVPEMIQEVARVLTGSNDLSGFLRHHFVGLLNSIDRKMLHAEDISLQKQTLKHIELLIELMGSQLSTYVPKIMVLLMHAVGKETLRSEGLSVLHFFIKQLVKVSPSSTKYVISQACGALIPFLERCKENTSFHLSKVVEILEELVVENKVLLKQHIRELPLLPSIPELAEVKKVIQEARGSMTSKDQLRDVVDGLNHESLNVRYMVVCELGKLLNLQRENVTALISGEAGSDLDRLKLVCADCLGALGAVDPATVKGISCERFKIECSDDDLIFEMIHKHLARAFRAAPDTIVQDSAALAIQDLLKIAGCLASLDDNVGAQTIQSQKGKEVLIEINMRGKRLWGRFSNYVKEIIAPCLTSRFQLPNVADSTWMFFWIRKLTVHATGSRASIFNACWGIVRHDMQTAMYLLPYLVLHVVCYSTAEARLGITEEILSRGSVNGVMGGQSEVCIQAVFTLLDNLGQWVDDVKQEVSLSQYLQCSKQQSSKSTGRNKDPPSKGPNQLLIQCNNVSELLAAIPKVTLAKASFRCKAYARALLYFESHRSGIFEDEDVSILMEIYSGLDEPDGLSGFAHLRKSSSLHDQLLINKKAGKWAEVLTSCEQALQLEPSSIQRHSDVLNCLLNMCHLQAMVTHVDCLISRVPKYKKTWCMQGVQAAWRLGRWDLMDEYISGADEEGLLCSSSESNACFDMDVAKILQAMMKKDQFSVAERIAHSKQALLAPLAAARMDSYARAYPFVVKLHMLRELEDFHSLLVNDSFLERSFHLDDPRLKKVIQDWENRMWFTQPSLWTREPLLAFQRLVFSASDLDASVGNCWLQYAKLSVLPQLVSRICHQNEDTVRLVKFIIISVLQDYPQQGLWTMSVSKSHVPARREAAAGIIQEARKVSRQGSDGSSLFVQFASLIDHLIRLCFHPSQSKAKAINISTEFTLDLSTISGIGDEAEILSSLQKPKKVLFIGSDGVERPFLCKPKDDLRKDARMIEFVSMINRLLAKYPESRRRKLYIRTFAVIPLREDCGTVEWVPHTRGLRHILQDIYTAHGKFDRQKTNPVIKRIYDQCQGKVSEEEMLKTKILPLFPPIFHKWFLTTFPEPAAWFRARVAYAHTTAVWSMVGDIVGLGDRHGENILFDSTTGDCVHVDFSCLFDKGLQLEKPELVPFRLTQNMIDGLGITGYEGIFLRVCEITLSVLRTHRETLMSVLETFIHDPLVEWTKSHKSSGVEVQNPHAQRAIGNIEARLQGIVVGVGAAPSLPLAVEGQARRLIAEAMSHRNLGKMYLWWMRWF
ncbi:hypothetical protein MKX01_022438 [Papaver californicum]|nr:hypothetical protein MKX01_022438 [Papaver californicum]